jgi:phage terminase small subunit
MGRRGRLPNPQSRRALAGKYGPVRVPTPGPVEPPESVTSRPAAIRFWSIHADTLVTLNRLRPELVESFALLCNYAADIEQLSQQVAAEGWVTAQGNGQAVSPVAKLLRDSRRDFVTLSKEFGLTAASSARLPQEVADGKTEKVEANPLRAFGITG